MLRQSDEVYFRWDESGSNLVALSLRTEQTYGIDDLDFAILEALVRSPDRGREPLIAELAARFGKASVVESRLKGDESGRCD